MNKAQIRRRVALSFAIAMIGAIAASFVAEFVFRTSDTVTYITFGLLIPILYEIAKLFLLRDKIR
jgi:hypothetical protein